MLAEDFEFDGEYLKDWGYMILYTDDNGGFNTIDSDSQLSFNTVSLQNGKKFGLTTAVYEDCIQLTFQIGKFSCRANEIEPISLAESRAIKRWLNRASFKKFKLIQPGWADIYMEGSFNVSNIEFNGRLYFLELTFMSNRPFALHEPITYSFDLSGSSDQYRFFDISDEIGYIYPDIKITCKKAGELRLTNSNEDRTTVIKNCTANEIITFTPELIMSTSSPTHKIQDDFNYNFFRISNTYSDRANIITSSLPVEIEITYSPYVKAVS